MINDNSPDELIDAIYRTVDDESAWNDVLDRLRRAFGDNAGLLGIVDATAARPMGVSTSVGFDPEEVRDGVNDCGVKHCGAADGAALHRERMRAGRTARDRGFTCDGTAFRRQALRDRFVEPADIVNRMNSLLSRTDRTGAGAPGRGGHGADRLSERETRLCRTLLPHLQRALRLRRRLAEAGERSSIVSGIVELLPAAAFVTTAAGRVLLQNGRAEELLGRQDALEVRRGYLTPVFAAESRELRALIEDAARNGARRKAGSAGATRISRKDGSRLIVSVTPVRGAGDRPLSGETDAGAAALVVVVDPDTRPPPPEAVIARIYGLTAAEARLAAAIAAGESVKAYAARMALSQNTVRWTLKMIFSKTGVSGQSNLVRQLSAFSFVDLNA